MHIFRTDSIENEQIRTFQALQSPSLNTMKHGDGHSIAEFFVYAVKRRHAEELYKFQKDYQSIFADSIWWRTHDYIAQRPVAQNTLLSSLYVLCQYFRRPPKGKTDERKKLQNQFINHLRQYLFRPFVLALKHLLEGRIFSYEKTLLADCFLRLLSELYSKFVPEYLLGTCTPYLICKLFVDCGGSKITHDVFTTYRLTYSNQKEVVHYFSDPVIVLGPNYNEDLIYESKECKQLKSKRLVDILSLIQYLRTLAKNDVQHQSKIDSYTIDSWPETYSTELLRLAQEQPAFPPTVITSDFQQFSMLTRNSMEDVIQHGTRVLQDRLLLLCSRQVCICLLCKQVSSDNGNIDYELTCFLPINRSLKTDITVRLSDAFYSNPERPDLKLPPSFRSQLHFIFEPRNFAPPVEQITLVVLDISASMLERRAEENFEPVRLLDISKKMLIKLSRNLHKQLRPNAIGLMLFGKITQIHCPITRSAHKFEEAVRKIPSDIQNWTNIYGAIEEGLKQIEAYDFNYGNKGKCNKLMVCITDGINNRPVRDLQGLKRRIRRANVAIDLVSFRETQAGLMHADTNKIINHLRVLCESSGGVIYRNATVKPLELEAIFEQEAVLWLEAREKPEQVRIGVGRRRDAPQRKFPRELLDPAVRIRPQQKFTSKAVQTLCREKRLEYEANELVHERNRLTDLIDVYVRRVDNDQKDYAFWKVTLKVRVRSVRPYY
ncbi:unnamed protein product [Rotaria sp. Silwood2]|nr:unnamed protein product [Rotaria sp. Silwood2]